MSEPSQAPVPSPRQTLSYLHRLFESYGLEAKTKLGQNFLIDLNLVDLIVRTAELDRSDAVLEVGTGTGSLTAKLADQAGAVVTVEIDKSLQPVAKEVVGERKNVRFVLGDALAKKNELNPDMLTAWDEAAKGMACTRRKLVANLPYVIATPLISNLLIAGTNLERMVVMVQWEIAERMRGAEHEGLQRAFGARAERCGCGGGAEGRSDELPPATEGRFGHRAHPPERRETREGRRRNEVPRVPARPVRPPAEESASGASRLADRAAREEGRGRETRGVGNRRDGAEQGA